MMKLLYPFLFLVFFLIYFYAFKVLVAKSRMKKLDAVIDDYPNFYLVMPLLTLTLIISIFLDKKQEKIKDSVSVKRLFFGFNDTMDLVAILLVVMIERGEIDLSRKSRVSILKKVNERLTTFLNSGKYAFT